MNKIWIAASMLFLSLSNPLQASSSLHFHQLFLKSNNKIRNGVILPPQERFAMNGQYFSKIGPGVELTAAHVFTAFFLRCETTEKSHPLWTGKPFKHRDNLWLVSPMYCKRKKNKNLWKYLKKNPTYPLSDWAIRVNLSELTPKNKRIQNPDFLTLDFDPVKEGEQLAIISHRRFPLKAAAFEVMQTKTGGAWMEALIKGRQTEKGDSGHPWFRVHSDNSLTVVAAHSAGLSGFKKIPKTCPTPGKPCLSENTSWAGIFTDAESKKAIEDLTLNYNIEICGVNRSCPLPKLPVSRKKLGMN